MFVGLLNLCILIADNTNTGAFGDTHTALDNENNEKDPRNECILLSNSLLNLDHFPFSDRVNKRENDFRPLFLDGDDGLDRFYQTTPGPTMRP